jgi:hypothetical protein
MQASFLKVWFSSRPPTLSAEADINSKQSIQQKLNCALHVKFLIFKNKCRDLPVKGRVKNGQTLRLAAAALTFYGEFDSGSERTVAAWIRHASRTGLSV